MSPIEVTTITTSKEMGNYVVEYPGATLVYNESAQTKMDQPQRSRNREGDREENPTKEFPSADQATHYLLKEVQELWKAKKSWNLCCTFEKKESIEQRIPTK